jgi:PadR family transcriptional regulator, regulatory protein PadR
MVDILPVRDTADALDRLELLQGTLDLLILGTLRGRTMHGHGIAKFIERSSHDRLKIEHGSLYPALQRLLQEGWIEGEWATSDSGRRARFYRLTTAGRRQLQAEQSRWRQFTEAMTLVLSARPAER